MASAKLPTEKIAVADGEIVRDARSGRLTKITSGKGVVKASATSGSMLEEASSKRRAALKRLADR